VEKRATRLSKKKYPALISGGGRGPRKGERKGTSGVKKVKVPKKIVNELGRGEKKKTSIFSFAKKKKKKKGPGKKEAELRQEKKKLNSSGLQ